MSTITKADPGNVYVNLDYPLPGSLNLTAGQNLIFVRAFRCAGGAFMQSLTLPSPCFVAANDVPYGTSIPGQPAGTYVTAIALVQSSGAGEIVIRFESRSPCQPRSYERRISFTVA